MVRVFNILTIIKKIYYLNFMKSYHNFIFEHYINLHTKDTKEKYADIVWEILQKSYAKIGGFKSVNSKDEMIETIGMWKLVKKNNEIVAVAVYKDIFGRKLYGLGSDGTQEGKYQLLKLLKDDATLNRSYAEVSGKMEEHYTNLGFNPIPSYLAEELLNKSGKEIISKDSDGYHYTRLIGGEKFIKIMFGNVVGFK